MTTDDKTSLTNSRGRTWGGDDQLTKINDHFHLEGDNLKHIGDTKSLFCLELSKFFKLFKKQFSLKYR